MFVAIFTVLCNSEIDPKPTHEQALKRPQAI